MRFRVIAITALCLLALAGCGGSEPEALATADAGRSEVDADGGVTSSSSAPATSAPAVSTTAATTVTSGSVPATASAVPTSGATPAPAELPATTIAAPVTTIAAPVTTQPPPPPPTAAPTGKACIVSLHGKGGGGQPEWTGSDGVRHSFPAGNASGWGGRQWLYYPDGNYQAARAIVANDVAAGGCRRVTVYGFSNGAAFAAKLYCRGETFGGTIVGYVIDDPVVDHAVEGCSRPGVRVVIYWTGGIDQPDGWNCGDWTCEGGSTIGIARYEAAVGVVRKPSIYKTHQSYYNPPELQSWF